MRTKKQKQCVLCQTVFQYNGSDTKKRWEARRFCSNACRHKGRIGYTFSEEARKKMSISATGRKLTQTQKDHLKVINIGKTHSQETKTKIRENALRGAQNHNWKGGITKLHRKIRALSEMKIWREHVFQRDDFTCVDCKERGCTLNADHEIPLSAILQMYKIETVEQAISCKFLWDIRNGRTLCVPCHEKTPTYKGKCISFNKANL